MTGDSPIQIGPAATGAAGDDGAFPYPLPEDASRIVVCHGCHGKNRVLLSRAFDQPDKLRCGRCGTSLLAAKDAPLSGLTGKLYQHPLDQQSLATLEAVPGVSTLLRKAVEVTVERYDNLFNESSFVRVGGTQMPTLERLFERAAYALDLRDLPALYVYQGPDANAFTGGVEAPYVALTSTLCDSMTDDELMAVMAHELAHVKNRDTLISCVAAMIAGAINGLTLPLFLSHSTEAIQSQPELVQSIVRYGAAINQPMDYVFIISILLAMGIWSVLILRTAVFPKWAGYLGISFLSLVLIGLVMKFNFIDLTGFRIFIFGLLSWIVSMGVLMMRR